MNDSTKPGRAVQYWLAVMLGLAILLTYVDRGAVATAAPKMNAELGLDPAQFGFLVSVFFYPYTLLQLVVGWLCDRHSVYRLFSWGVAIWALATLLTGFVEGFVLLVALRLLLGLGEAICFPGASKIIAQNIAPERRGLSNAIVIAGVAFGPAVGTLFGGMILIEWGWRAIFTVFGGLTLVWLLPWMLISRRLVDVSPQAAAEPTYPMHRLLRFRALWAVSLGHFCGNFVIYFIVAWLPLYLAKERALGVETMTVLATATFMAQGVMAIVAGWGSDRWTASGRDEGAMRRTLSAGGALVSALGIVGIAYSPNSLAVLLPWLLLTGAAAGVLSINIFALAQMFAGPRLAGSWVGVQNFFANFAGIIAPAVTGVMIARSGNYTSAFMLAAAVSVLGGLSWLFFMPKVRQVEVGAA